MNNIVNVTPIRDEFDLNGSIKAHFSLIKTHPSGRRAYLRIEKSGVTSIEVIKPVKKKHPVTGETYYAYPSSEQFGAFGAYISVRNEMKLRSFTWNTGSMSLTLNTKKNIASNDLKSNIRRI